MFGNFIRVRSCWRIKVLRSLVQRKDSHQINHKEKKSLTFSSYQIETELQGYRKMKRLKDTQPHTHTNMTGTDLWQNMGVCERESMSAHLHTLPSVLIDCQIKVTTLSKTSFTKDSCITTPRTSMNERYLTLRLYILKLVFHWTMRGHCSRVVLTLQSKYTNSALNCVY